jgi:hypothetical protein
VGSGKQGASHAEGLIAWLVAAMHGLARCVALVFCWLRLVTACRCSTTHVVASIHQPPPGGADAQIQVLPAKLWPEGTNWQPLQAALALHTNVAQDLSTSAFFENHDSAESMHLSWDVQGFTAAPRYCPNTLSPCIYRRDLVPFTRRVSASVLDVRTKSQRGLGMVFKLTDRTRPSCPSQ